MCSHVQYINRTNDPLKGVVPEHTYPSQYHERPGLVPLTKFSFVTARDIEHVQSAHTSATPSPIL